MGVHVTGLYLCRLNLARSSGAELAGLPGDPITDVSLACSYQWSANALTSPTDVLVCVGDLVNRQKVYVLLSQTWRCPR